MNSITDVIGYARNLLRIPYRWHREGDPISGDDKFWASNEPAPTPLQIRGMNKSIVCTGLVNLMRRYQGLTIPGLDGKLGEVGREFPGTTGIWFMYLMNENRLQPFNPLMKYPRGTMLLRNFADVVEDQGHVAVILTEQFFIYDSTKSETQSQSKKSSLDEYIIHSYANIDYHTSLEQKIENVGEVGLTLLRNSHYWSNQDSNLHKINYYQEEMPDGYYTHVCLPENWLFLD